jgi:hypothetical protein
MSIKIITGRIKYRADYESEIWAFNPGGEKQIGAQIFSKDTKVIRDWDGTAWVIPFPTSGGGMEQHGNEYHTPDMEAANANIQTHVQSVHAPSNAQKNSDIIKSEIEARLTGEINTHTHAGGSAQIGYAINVQALTSSPADGATVYFGMLPKAPVTTANISKIYIRKMGTIKIAEIYCYSGTAGTNQAWSLYVRKNNTTDYLIATLSVATNERIFSNAALSIAVVVGDYVEIKGVQPTWTTNPLTCIYGGYLYIE